MGTCPGPERGGDWLDMRGRSAAPTMSLRWTPAGKAALWPHGTAPFSPTPVSIVDAALKEDGIATVIIGAGFTLAECRKAGLRGDHMTRLFRDAARGDGDARIRRIQLLRDRVVDPVKIVELWDLATLLKITAENWDRAGITWRDALKIKPLVKDSEAWLGVGGGGRQRPCGHGFSDEQWDYLLS